MKITMPASDLKPLVDACVQIVPGTKKRPVLECIRVEVSSLGDGAPSYLTMTASDLHRHVQFKVDADVGASPGLALVPAENLARACKQAKKGLITIGWNGKGSQATLRFAKAKVSLPVEPIDNWPRLQFFDNELPSITLPYSLLEAAFARTAFAVEKNVTGRSLTCVQLRIGVDEPDQFRAAGLDGVRMGCLRATVENPQNVSATCLVPPFKLRILKSIVINRDDRVDVQITKSQFRVRGTRGVVTLRLGVGTFPPIDQSLGLVHRYSIMCKRKALIELLEEANMIKAPGQTSYEFRWSNNQLEIEARSGFDGMVRAVMETDFVGDLTIKLDPSLLAEGARVMKSDDVRLRFESPTIPVTLHEDSDRFDYSYLLMTRL